MLSFKQHLTEAKNTHMEHLEDMVFIEGVAGTRKAINFLRDIRNMLSGHSTSKVTATVKWDGAPAIFAGIDPTDGKFFVAKKGVFNKNPKVYKTDEDIDADTNGELADKFKIALRNFKKLGIKSGVYQGDLMFTKGDQKTEVINGEKYITFHPNTIVYAVPYASELGKKIRTAEIGVVWHTTYTGDSFETMSAEFGKSIVNKLKHSPSIWMDDANYHDYSGNATFTAAETEHVTELLSKIGTLFHEVSAGCLNHISNDEDLLQLVLTFNNSKIRANQTITNPKQHVKELFNWIHDRYQKEIDAKKTEKGKQGWEEKRQKIISFFATHDQAEIAKIFELSMLLGEVKKPIIEKMNKAASIKTFLKTKDGFEVTGVEGFVAIDHLTGGAVKIVDRMEFSRANFSADILKGWQR
jgi:hypothetical protein